MRSQLQGVMERCFECRSAAGTIGSTGKSARTGDVGRPDSCSGDWPGHSVQLPAATGRQHQLVYTLRHPMHECSLNELLLGHGRQARTEKL